MKILLKRLKRDYGNLAEFMRRSGIPLVPETVRKAIYANLPVEIPSLIIICKYLGFSANEIKEIIKKAGDKEYHILIGNQKINLTGQEKAIIEAVNKIKTKNPLMLNIIADYFELIGKSLHINLSKELQKIKRKER